MTSALIDRRLGLVGNAAIKAPVAAVTILNVTLSGEQTIDGYAVKAVNASGVPDRVLVTGQTDATQNGIWDVATAAWTRSADADGIYDLAKSSLVIVSYGNTWQASAWQLITAEPFVIGTSSLTWVPISITGVASPAVEVQTATAGQTVFTLQALTFLPGTNSIRVFINGFRVTDFTEPAPSITPANTITLTSAMAGGEEVLFDVTRGIAIDALYTPTGATPRVDSIQSVLRETIKRPQDNGDVLGDATTAIQNAIDALAVSGSELLVLDIGDMALRVDGTLTTTVPLTVRGQGFLDLDNSRTTDRPTRGSWLIHNNAVGPLFELNSQAAKNSGFERVAFYQTGHPAPGVGWAPAVRDWVIRAESMQGTLRLKECHFHNVYQGVLVDEAHRPRIEDITGQFFYRGFKFDRIYDEGSVDGLRGWTYWSEDNNVLAWTQANGRLVTMGRVDGMHFGKRLFGFGLADVLYFGAGAVAGSARVITVNDIYADFCKRAMVVDNGVTHVTVGSLFHLGQTWPSAPTLALAGSCGLEIVSGNNSEILIGQYTGSLCQAATVKVSGGTANQVWVESPIFEQYDKSASGSGPVSCVAGNQVWLGNNAQAVNYAGSSTPLITGAAAGVIKAPLAQQFVGGAASNKLAASANSTGGLAVLTVEGDADAGMALLAKTTGGLQFGSSINRMGFFGTAPVVRPTGVTATSSSMFAALQTLGLFTT